MDIDNNIQIKVFDGVYCPSDDSYLLLNSLNTKKRNYILDMGCGSGIIALHLAKQDAKVTASDISANAVLNTKFNAYLNKINLEVIQSNLFEKIKGKFDIIVFNPPYLPTSNENIAWDGGPNGLAVIQPFLESAQDYLNLEGNIYIIISSLTDAEKMIAINKILYNFEIISKKRVFFEDLFVYKITRNSKEKSA